MIRILLLGRSGQIGQALERRLSGEAELTALGRSELDLADTVAIRARLTEIRPHLVINAAAWTAVDAAEEDRAGCVRINAIAPGVVAAEAERLGAAMIHYSTDYVFDGSGRRHWRETDPPRPLNTYGAAKLAGELAVAAACPAHLVIRTSWVYDEHGANFLGAMLRLMRERQELRVVCDQIGAPTSAEVVARATAAIVARAGPDLRAFFAAHGGLVHCACRGGTSWHGFAETIMAEAGRRGLPVVPQAIAAITSADYPLAARRPGNSRLALARLRRAYGIVTPHWRAALAEVLDRVAQR